MFLRSLNRHLNSTVFYGPPDEGSGGADVGDDTVLDVGGGSPDGGDDAGDSDSSGEPQERLTVREQIKKSIAETSEPPAAKPKRDAKSGRFGDRQPKGADADAAPAEAEPAAPTAPAIEAPASLSPEAKAAWDKAPPEIQAAFVKREQDMAQGVEQLKQRYTLIDQAIAPHQDALRQMNATPADAVNRMFLWFKALAGRPADAFPALAQSMGIDWNQLSGAKAGEAPAAVPAADGTGAPEIPEPVKAYVGQLEGQLRQLTEYVQQIGGRFGDVEQTISSQNDARTRENLALWSDGKEYFEEVRQDMAKLIETGMVPLKADGQVDLDTAYERAIHFNPTVRAKVLAAQQQANQEVQQKTEQAATTANQSQVNKARKAAGGSLSASTTPGASAVPVGTAKKKPGQKMSVRESLKAAVAELRDQ